MIPKSHRCGCKQICGLILADSHSPGIVKQPCDDVNTPCYILESSGKEEDEGSGQEGEDEQTEEEAEIEEDSGIYIYSKMVHVFGRGMGGGG